VLGLVAGEVHAADGTENWQAGLARAKITPEKPVPLAGFGDRVTRPFEAVEQDIYAKALALQDSQGGRALLLTLDLVTLDPSWVEPICEAIGRKTGLKRREILLNCSHTHSGPMTGLDTFPEVVAYTRQLQDKVVDVGVQALAKMEPARLSWGEGVATFVMNRRVPLPTRIQSFRPNPRGPADRSVPVLRVDTPAGKLRAVLFQCACHPSCLGADNYRLCNDYAGFAAEHIEKDHPSIQAMFMQGCGGDGSVYPRGTMELARAHGEGLGKEVCRVLQTKLAVVRGPLRVELDKAPLPLQRFTREALAQFISGAGTRDQDKVPKARHMLAALEKGEKLPTQWPAPIAVWQFGQDLTLVGISGETVVDYVIAVEQALGPGRLWTAGYCNEIFGYLPSARLVKEGGYETRGPSRPYPPPPTQWGTRQASFVAPGANQGFFTPDVEQAVVGKVRELAARAGREVGSP
jgi:hypothetical protein